MNGGRVLTIAYSTVYQWILALKEKLSRHSLPVVIMLQRQLILEEVHICSLILPLSEIESPFVVTDFLWRVLPFL